MEGMVDGRVSLDYKIGTQRHHWKLMEQERDLSIKFEVTQRCQYN